MPDDAPSDSDTQETDSNPSSDELESPQNGGTQKMSDYERQRAKRIEENRARMEALGLHKMACSIMGSVQITKKKKRETKGKAKRGEEDDEEYRPPEEGEEEGLSSSSGEEDEDQRSSGVRRSKAQKKHSTPKTKGFDQNFTSNLDIVDDDEALFQAIALSLKDSTQCSKFGHIGRSQSSNAHSSKGMINDRKGNANIQEDKGKKNRKKPVTGRVKMTEDEFVLHFCQFDEAGKGGITLRDIKRVTAAHDFTWTDKEMADMIFCFDSDGDGKNRLQSRVTRVGRFPIHPTGAVDNEATFTTFSLLSLGCSEAGRDRVVAPAKNRPGYGPGSDPIQVYPAPVGSEPNPKPPIASPPAFRGSGIHNHLCG